MLAATFDDWIESATGTNMTPVVASNEMIIDLVTAFSPWCNDTNSYHLHQLFPHSLHI
ncbi:MAG: hypothetical protein WBL88_04490 [Nitrososphaeraceae archaeon]|jgi:hypothetical protein